MRSRDDPESDKRIIAGRQLALLSKHSQTTATPLRITSDQPWTSRRGGGDPSVRNRSVCMVVSVYRDGQADELRLFEGVSGGWGRGEGSADRRA